MVPQSDPEFGPLLVRKKFPRELVLPAILATLLLALFSFMAFSIGLKLSRSPGTSPWRLPDLLLFSAFAALPLAAIMIFIYRMAQGVYFYQAGAVQTSFGRRVGRVAYADCVAHKFYQVHLSKHDSYRGTLTKLYLTGSNKQAVRYLATHKLESVRNGGFFSLGFHVVGTNPIDAVAWRSASVIADQWIARLKADESIEWTKLATLTPTGIASWSGRSHGTLALYSELAPIRIDGTNAVCTLLDGTPFLTLSTRDVNFYPGYFVAFAMIDRASPDTESIDGEAT